jgi:hypothetical protein
VVHLQHGIGRYLGLKNLPVGAGRKMPLRTPNRRNRTPARNVWSSNTRRAIRTSRAETLRARQRGASGQQIRGRGQGAPAAQHAGRHALGQGQGAGRTRRARRGGELLRIQAVRESQPGHAFRRTRRGSANLRAPSSTRKRPTNARHRRNQGRHGTAQADGPADLRRRGFRQNGGGHSRRVQGGDGRRQVAVLVPTTVLAQQHFNTFRERMADYPVRVELLSRFARRASRTRW